MCRHIVDCTFFFIVDCLFACFFWFIIVSINSLKYIIAVSLNSSIDLDVDLDAWGGGLGLGLGRVSICLNCSQCQPSWQLFLI